MSIIVDCVRCRRRLEARDEWAGRQVKCPGCGETLIIALPAVPLQAKAAPPPATPVAPPQARPACYGAAPSAHPPPRDGLTDLLEAAASAAPAPPIPRPAPQSASGAKGRRKSSSNATVFALLGSSVGCLVVCGGLTLAFLIPMVRGFRAAAARAEAQRAAQRASPFRNSPVLHGPGTEPAVASGPVWAPDPQLLTQLSVNATFDRYSMRLPAGFTLTNSHLGVKLREGVGHSWAWMSEARQNEHRRVLHVTIIDYDKPPRGSTSELEEAIASQAESMTRGGGYTVMPAAPPEAGQIAGKQFLRSRFAAIESRRLSNCTVLSAFDGKRILTIKTMCNEGPETLEYQLLDAATLTFRQH